MPGELAKMASKWRIDGVFWTCALKKRGQVFTRVGLLVDLYSVFERWNSVPEGASSNPDRVSSFSFSVNVSSVRKIMKFSLHVSLCF